MDTLEALRRQYRIDGVLDFARNAAGAAIAVVTTPAATAEVALAGAQVLGWQPAGQAPVIWLSPAARFVEGKAPRGGIPICWPWFGAHTSDATLPAHGFVRTASWRVRGASVENGSVTLRFAYSTGEATRGMWPHDADLALEIVISHRLRLRLATLNTGASPFVLGQALHTYFHVGDIASAHVVGLEGQSYIDTLAGHARLRQDGPIAFAEEVDRVYLGAPQGLAIVDRALSRRITIEAGGSASTVVWNPWIAKSARLGDMGADGYRRMLCVETANAFDDQRRLSPGERHELSLEIGVSTL
ncbi:MAG: D-hexose-6-phosphate mutarotase [Hyphomicrobiaceae bacterium]|nr:D-hexose-6-phosphate mutarotase [Hyphomicrobiaceae bacterium]